MEQNAANYVALFNEIDKYLDKILQTEKFMPYNEKLKQIINGSYHISPFIKKHEAKLKYFGELRNHIAHGQQFEGQYYSVPTYHAVDDLRKCKEEILKPVSAIDLFARAVYTCTTTDLLQNVIIEMRNHNESHVAVYDNTGLFVGVLTETTLSNWLADQSATGSVNMHTIRVGDLDLTETNDTYLFVAQDKNIYEIQALFEASMLSKKRLGVIYITTTGSDREKILGVVSALDIPKIASYHFIA